MTVRLVATHHKSGTVWMQSVFKNAAKVLDLPFVIVNDGVAPTDPAPGTILFDWHSRIDLGTLPADARILHFVRDPRDMLVSAARYHQKSTEEWLHKPQDRAPFNGQTYQDYMNALPEFEDKVLFELANATQFTLKNLRKWPIDDPRSFEARFESFLEDETMILFRSALKFLAFTPDQIEKILAIYWEKSYFGKLQGQDVKHATSDGSRAQWRKSFSPAVTREFSENWGDVLVKYGYERDQGWAEALQ